MNLTVNAVWLKLKKYRIFISVLTVHNKAQKFLITHSILDTDYLFWGASSCQKTQLLAKNFPKVPKSDFCDLFFHKFGQNGFFIVIWESSENQFGRPQKKLDKIFEKILDQSLVLCKISLPTLGMIFKKKH